MKKKLKIEKKDRVCSQEADKYYLLNKYNRYVKPDLNKILFYHTIIRNILKFVLNESRKYKWNIFVFKPEYKYNIILP